MISDLFKYALKRSLEARGMFTCFADYESTSVCVCKIATPSVCQTSKQNLYSSSMYFIYIDSALCIC